MISKVTFTNFQCHKSTEILFSPGLNVFIGTSRHGKSAIIRGLRWNLENKPQGDSFTRHGSKKVEVEIFTNDGAEIKRLRTPSKNMYVLNGKPYSSFGNTVPEVVLNRSQLTSINIQGQHDRMFLLSESPGEISRVINQLASLDDIDVALTEINKMERSAKIQAETAKEQRTEAEKECEDYKGFKNLQKRISWFRTFADKVEAGQKKIALLTRYVTTLETVERNILLVAWTDEIREKVEGIEERKLELDKRSEAVNVLFTHYRNLTENNKIIVKANNFRTLLPVIASLQEKLDALEERKRKAAKLRQLVSKLEEATSQVDVETINLVKQKIQGIAERLKALEKRKEKRADLWNLVRNLEVFEERIEKFEEETSEARAELAELLPEECPICGTPKEEWRKNNA